MHESYCVGEFWIFHVGLLCGKKSTSFMVYIMSTGFMKLFLCIVLATSKWTASPQHDVDYQQVFASLTQQFEAQCQLANKMQVTPSDKKENVSLNTRNENIRKENTPLPNKRKEETRLLDNRKEVIKSRKRLISSLNNRMSDNKHDSLSKDHQQQHGMESEKSLNGAPVLKKIRIDFTWDGDTTSSSATEPHSLWLVPNTNKPVTPNESVAEADTTAISDWLFASSTSPVNLDITELFNLITNSDTSTWLISSTPQTMDTSSGLSLLLHPPPSEGVAEVVNSIAETDLSSWLLDPQDIKQQDDSNASRLLRPSSPNASDLQIAEVQSNTNDQWLMPRCKCLLCNVLCKLFSRSLPCM